MQDLPALNTTHNSRYYFNYYSMKKIIQYIPYLPWVLLLSLGIAPEKTEAQLYKNIPHQPMKSAGASYSAIFSLPHGDTQYYMRVNLPDDNFLIIRFGRLSYWKDKSLPAIVDGAHMAWQQLKDSFKNPAAARRLAMYVPDGTQSAVAACKEYPDEAHIVLLDGKTPEPLRVAMDSISIVRAYGPPRPESGLIPRVGYLFLLKDMNDIEELAKDEALINNISGVLDSLVLATRNRWKDFDHERHNLDAMYDVRKGLSGPMILTTAKPFRRFWRYDPIAEVGASVLAGSITGYSSFGLRFHFSGLTTDWGGHGWELTQYFGAAYSVVNFFDRENNKLHMSTLQFVNVEYGRADLKKNQLNPVYVSTFGIGYRIRAKDPAPYDLRYRCYVKWNLTRSITLTPQTYIIPETNGEKAKCIVGLDLSVRFIQLR